jgi:hypothetical protein
VSEKTSSAFRMSYRVTADIRASEGVIWAKLTNAADYPKWNSTVASIAGPIALGQKLAIQVPIAPGRTFSPKVVAFEPGRTMVWQDGFFPMFQGTRTYTLTPGAGGVTRFEMEEVFRGAMLPMIRGSLPDFGPPFDQFAADLKKACEAG